MFPHEELMLKALKECKISTLVHDLGALYTKLVNENKSATNADFQQALVIERILSETAAVIADLGPKPDISYAADGVWNPNRAIGGILPDKVGCYRFRDGSCIYPTPSGRWKANWANGAVLRSDNDEVSYFKTLEEALEAFTGSGEGPYAI